MDNNTNISPGHIIRTRRPDPIPTQKTRFGSVPDPSKIPYWVALFKNRRTDTRSDLIRYPVGFPKNRKYANPKSLIYQIPNILSFPLLSIYLSNRFHFPNFRFHFQKLQRYSINSVYLFWFNHKLESSHQFRSTASSPPSEASRSRSRSKITLELGPFFTSLLLVIY